MTQQKILNAFEDLSESYNEMIEHKSHNAYYDRPNTLSLFPEKIDGAKILDAACGSGKYAEILIRRGAWVKGFDISPKMIALARKRNNNTSGFFVHNLMEPLHMFTPETFDFVLCALALEYLEDWNFTIGEFNRVLKPGGTLIISVGHPFFDYNLYQSKEYFQVEPVKYTWTGFDKPIEINSFRRSLSDCFAPINENGFYIDKVLEPKPTIEMKEADPRHYKELNQFPCFLCLRGRKK